MRNRDNIKRLFMVFVSKALGKGFALCTQALSGLGNYTVPRLQPVPVKLPAYYF